MSNFSNALQAAATRYTALETAGTKPELTVFAMTLRTLIESGDLTLMDRTVATLMLSKVNAKLANMG